MAKYYQQSLDIKRFKQRLATHWSTLSRVRMLMMVLVLTVMFERGVVVGVELDVGWLRWTTSGVYREVHQVGRRNSPVTTTTTTSRATSLPAWSVTRSEKLVVVELVAASPSVALVLRHRVRDRLVHVDVHLGAQHGHVVTWRVERLVRLGGFGFVKLNDVDVDYQDPIKLPILSVTRHCTLW